MYFLYYNYYYYHHDHNHDHHHHHHIAERRAVLQECSVLPRWLLTNASRGLTRTDGRTRGERSLSQSKDNITSASAGNKHAIQSSCYLCKHTHGPTAIEPSTTWIHPGCYSQPCYISLNENTDENDKSYENETKTKVTVENESSAQTELKLKISKSEGTNENCNAMSFSKLSESCVKLWAVSIIISGWWAATH